MKAQQNARKDITEPHTFDTREQLMNATIAGQNFRTNSGAYNNGDDMIVIKSKRLLQKKSGKEEEEMIHTSTTNS